MPPAPFKPSPQPFYSTNPSLIMQTLQLQRQCCPQAYRWQDWPPASQSHTRIRIRTKPGCSTEGASSSTAASLVPCSPAASQQGRWRGQCSSGAGDSAALS